MTKMHGEYPGPSMSRSVRALLLSGLLPFSIGFVACQSSEVDIVRCKNIPAGGCPDRAGVDDCLDRTCTELYRCNADQSWTKTSVCVGNEAGAVDASVADTRPPRDVSIDAPPGAGGGPGCGDLTLPDCNLLYALECPRDCCGCEDIFICANGGWNAWGTCVGGQIAPAR
jgi:hypothetical protein